MKNDEIQIVAADEKYLKGINELGYEIFEYHKNLLPEFYSPRDKEQFEQRYLEIMGCETAIFLVALSQGQVVGFILAQIVEKPWQKISRICFVEEIGVHHSYRRRGIGQKIFDAFRQECRKRQIGRITLNVYNLNKSAILFYEKMGFKALSTRMNLNVE